MAFAVNDRVRETSTTTGTGTFTLAGSIPGFETFSTAIGNSNTTYYAIQNQSTPTEFEIGIGTVGAGTLSRDTIISSSNSDAAVNFSAGTKDVFCTLPASKAVLENDSGVASATTFLGSGAQLTNLNASNVASGTVDNARLDADLAAIGNLTSAADKGIQFTGSGTAATYDLTTAGKALLDDADASAQRTTLGLVIGTDVQAYDAQLADIAGLTPTDSNFIVGNGSNFVTESGATARTSLGLGSIATLNEVALGTNTSGNYVESLVAGNLIDLQNNSGEGATPTVDVDLSELATSTSDADGDFFAVVDDANAQKKLTKANINISGFNNDSGFIDGSALNADNLSSGTIPDARFPATLPAVSGANLTNLDADALASGTVPDARFPATLPAANGSALTNLDASNLASGTVANARLDAQLQDVAGLAVTNGNFIVGNGSNFVAESGSTARDSLSLGTSNDVQFDSFGVGTAASGTTGEIRATNDVTAFYSSDKSLKENIKNIEHPLEKISQINGVTFDWTEEYIKQHGGEDKYFVRKNDVGVIAQEIEKVLPQVVATRENGIKAVKYDRIVALLIESVKELKKEIEELKSGA